jgi:hypothetical protein
MATLPKLGPSVLDAQLLYIKDNAERVLLVKDFLRADTYATMVATKILAELDVTNVHAIWGAISNITSGNGADANAPNRQMAINSVVLDAATAGYTGTEMALVFVDDTGTEILASTDETSDREVVTLDVITTFAWYIQASQATLV